MQAYMFNDGLSFLLPNPYYKSEHICVATLFSRQKFWFQNSHLFNLFSTHRMPSMLVFSPLPLPSLVVGMTQVPGHGVYEVRRSGESCGTDLNRGFVLRHVSNLEYKMDLNIFTTCLRVIGRVATFQLGLWQQGLLHRSEKRLLVKLVFFMAI
ncbi:hypothetical protein P154DRAFT_361786 [Amniculicola lignicola CBS 123094]|uniref:Uncharacterized protein n=1 Tax=Amniculicola lignicola CBS 123094 TaxID=1392246 RepID=A0A6A5W4A7_9PLEO|nr:hypothetical protein P154DRAFT_361786 [Amniculicola lignicola CBS 123094]